MKNNNVNKMVASATMLLKSVAFLSVITACTCSHILMITMGGTKSHKIPYYELARGLIGRGHNVSFISAFPPDFDVPGLVEICPPGLVFYVKNFTNWDLVGNRMRGEDPVSPWDVMRYPPESCEEMYSDAEMKSLLNSNQKFDLIIMDAAFPECSIALAYHYKVPFIYINTVAFYTFTLSLAGNPSPYSISPFLSLPYTDDMNLVQRIKNFLTYTVLEPIHSANVKFLLQPVLNKHFGSGMPKIFDLSKNVSFILQNAHASVTHPRPYLPNVAEIACIHCKPAKPLPPNLEEFINGSGDDGFIYFSMGSSVKAANMPEYLRRMLLYVFKQLPQRVLWKWESDDMTDLPDNVMLGKWLPQQDILGHPKIKAFVTHGGLLSIFETVYHGVPIVTLPVFCDQDSNAAKAEQDGFAIKLDLATLTPDSLLWAIKKLTLDPKYRIAVKERQVFLKDQKEDPLERAIYWTEYVIKHNGAYHLQSSAKDLNFMQYYCLDVVAILILILLLLTYIIRSVLKFIYSILVGNLTNVVKKSIKIE